jgi:hypothetical protein
MGEGRGYLGQGTKDKSPLMQTVMRDDEIRLFDDDSSIEEYIQIDDPRSHRNSPQPSHLFLNSDQELLERMRRQHRHYRCHAIDEPILLSVSYRFCFVEGRDGLYMRVTGYGYPLEGAEAIGYLITEV